MTTGTFPEIRHSWEQSRIPLATGDKLGNVVGCSVGVVVGAVGAVVAIVVGDSVGGVEGATRAVINKKQTHENDEL